MANITWRNVNAPDFGQAGALAAQGGKTVQDALSILGKVFETERQSRVNEQNTVETNALNEALAKLQSANSMEDLQSQQGGLLGAIPEARKADLIAAIQGQEDRLMGRAKDNLGMALTQEKIQGSKLGNEAKAIDNSSLAARNQAGLDSTLAGIRNSTAQAEAQETRNKFLEDQLQIDLANSGSIAERNAVLAKYEEDMRKDALANSAHNRSISSGQLAVSQGNLALNKQRAANDMLKAVYEQQNKAKGESDKSALLTNLTEAYKSGNRDDIAKYTAEALNGGVSASALNAVKDASGTGKDTGFKGFTDGLKASLKNASDDTNTEVPLAIDAFAANKWTGTDSSGGQWQLNNAGIKNFQTALAKEINSRIFNDVEVDDVEAVMANFLDNAKRSGKLTDYVK